MNTTQSVHSPTQKVLIVDDEKAMAKAMEIKLQKEGIDALAVFSGQEGLAELQSGRYSLVLLDIMMPEFDGWEVLAGIRSSSLTTTIIITSNLSQEEDKQKAKDLGATDFLVKSDASLSAIAESVKGYLKGISLRTSIQQEAQVL